MPITRHRLIQTTLLALTCGTYSLLTSAHSINFDPDWLRIERRAVLDQPEQPVSAMSLLRREQADSPPHAFKSLLSEHNGLFFLNLYQDQAYQQRAFKLGPLPLLSSAELSQCGHFSGVANAEKWAGSRKLSPELNLYEIRFDCAQGEYWQHSVLLLVDNAVAGTPRIAIGRAKDKHNVEFSAWQVVAAEHTQRWSAALETRRFDFQNWLPQPQSALHFSSAEENSESPMQQLRRLHQTAFDSSDKGPHLEPLNNFLQRHDYRQLGLEDTKYPRLLNDIGHWLTQAGQLEAARPLLLEVLRREPQRMPTHLNLADLDWQLFQTHSAPFYAERAREYYRIYCGMRLTKELHIPPRVAERLQAKQLNASLCRAHWPLIRAIDAGDLATTRSLLDSGIPATTLGEDGRGTLLHALDKPDLALATLLVERGAELQGLYNHLPLVTHALRLDLKQNPNLLYAERLHFLLDSGAAIDEVDYRGETLLMQFSREKRGLETLFALLEYPQNLDIRDHQGNTALYWALRWQNPQAVEMLMAKGANLNLLYKEGLCGDGRDIQHSALLTLARDLDPQLSSPQLFASLLALGANPTLGQSCEMSGYDLLLQELVHKQRADLLSILAQMHMQRPPLHPKISAEAHQRLQNSQGEQRQHAQQVLDALLALGPS